MSKARRIPKYERYKKDYARVRINGNEHPLGRYGSPESHLRYDELIAEYVTGETATGGTTLTQVLAKFWRHAKQRYGKSGKGPYGAAINWRPLIQLLREKHGSESPERFGPRAFRSLIEDMLTLGWSRQYANEQVSRTKHIFKWAASHEMVSLAAYQKLTTVDGVRLGEMDFRETEPVEPVDDALVDATIPWMAEPVGDMVAFQRLTGARPGEVCNLLVSDVDRSAEVWMCTLRKHKTLHKGKVREICVGPRGQEILKRHLLKPTDAFVFKPKWVRSCGHYTTDSYRRAIQRACERRCRDEQIPLKKWAPNQLRHSAATAVRAEFDLETASSFLGHSSTQVTEGYAERSKQRAIEAAKRLG